MSVSQKKSLLFMSIHCLHRRDIFEIDMSAMAHHHRKMDFVLIRDVHYSEHFVKSSKQRMAIKNPSLEASSHL